MATARLAAPTFRQVTIQTGDNSETCGKGRTRKSGLKSSTLTGTTLSVPAAKGTAAASRLRTVQSGPGAAARAISTEISTRRESNADKRSSASSPSGVLNFTHQGTEYPIPVLDLGGLTEEPGARQALVEQMHGASSEYGIFYAVNHGVSPDLITSFTQAANKVFDLPVEEKLKFQSPPGSFRRAGFAFEMEESAIVALNTHREIWRTCSVWPDELVPEFRTSTLAYRDAALQMGRYLCGLATEALGLPRGYLHEQLGEVQMKQTLFRYPPGVAQRGLGPHTDYPLFVLLLQEVDGLQVWRNGEWTLVPASVRHGILVFNGDLLECFSNGEYHSPVHRVCGNPAQRLTAAASVEPGPEVVVGPAPALVGPGRPAKYRSVKFGDRMKTFTPGFGRDALTKEFMLADPGFASPERDLSYKDGVFAVGGVRIID